MTPELVRSHLDGLVKPPGSLGRLENLAVRLCVIQRKLAPRTTPRRVVLFAADHGVVAEGVPAWPAEVTRLMVYAIRSGGAASSVLAAATGTVLRLLDVGVPGLGRRTGRSTCAGRSGPGRGTSPRSRG